MAHLPYDLSRRLKAAHQVIRGPAYESAPTIDEVEERLPDILEACRAEFDEAALRSAIQDFVLQKIAEARDDESVGGKTEREVKLAELIVNHWVEEGVLIESSVDDDEAPENDPAYRFAEEE